MLRELLLASSINETSECRKHPEILPSRVRIRKPLQGFTEFSCKGLY